MTIRGEAEFQLGQFTALLTLLEGRMDLNAEELCLVGRAELRFARYDAAELHLLRAALLGAQHASVEYAEVLFETGRTDEAVRHLTRVLPDLQGTERGRAMHLLTRLHLHPNVQPEPEGGEPQREGASVDPHRHAAPAPLLLAARDAQEAAQYFLRRGEEEEAGQVAVTLAEISLLGGDLDRAERLLRLALTVLNTAPDPGPRGRALLLLVRLFDLRGDDLAVQATVDELQALLTLEGTVRVRLAWQVLQAERCALKGDWDALDRETQGALPLAASLQDPLALGRLHLARAEGQIRRGPPADAAPAAAVRHHAGIITELARVPLAHDPHLWALEGRAALHRHDLDLAVPRLQAATSAFRRSGRPLDELRAALDLAACHAAAQDAVAMTAALQAALPRLLRLQERRALRALVEAHHDLLQDACQDPRLAPHVQALMDAADTQRQWVLPLRVLTLGEQHVMRRSQTLPLRTAVPLLAYLHLHPGSTRRDIQLALFPDRPPGAALSAVKLAIHALRRELGPDAVETSGPYRDKRYRLGPDPQLQFDTAALDQALQMQDVSRALHVYAGPFLPFHGEGEWVEAQRAEQLANLKLLVRNRIDFCLRLDDWGNARLICQEFMTRDPDDLDAPRWLEEIRQRSQVILQHTASG